MEAQTRLRKQELDYFYNVLMDFLKHHSFDWVGFQWRGRNLPGFVKKSSFVFLLRKTVTSVTKLTLETENTMKSPEKEQSQSNKNIL